MRTVSAGAVHGQSGEAPRSGYYKNQAKVLNRQVKCAQGSTINNGRFSFPAGKALGENGLSTTVLVHRMSCSVRGRNAAGDRWRLRKILDLVRVGASAF